MTWWGTLIVGIPAAVPVSFALFAVLRPLHLWAAEDVRTSLEFVVVWGGPMSLAVWWEAKRGLRKLAEDRYTAPPD